MILAIWCSYRQQNPYGTNNSSFAFKVFDDGGTSNGGQDTDQTANTWRFNVNPIDDYAVVSGDSSGSALQFDGTITGDLNATDVEGLTDLDYFQFPQMRQTEQLQSILKLVSGVIPRQIQE